MKAHDIRETMSGEPHFGDGDESGKAAFWMAQSFSGGAVWMGQWEGTSPWELHPDSDEFLHTLEGSAQVTLLTEAGEELVEIPAGSVFVVPKGVWHKQRANAKVVQMGVTPGATRHSTADDPRS